MRGRLNEGSLIEEGMGRCEGRFRFRCCCCCRTSFRSKKPMWQRRSCSISTRELLLHSQHLLDLLVPLLVSSSKRPTSYSKERNLQLKTKKELNPPSRTIQSRAGWSSNRSSICLRRGLSEDLCCEISSTRRRKRRVDWVGGKVEEDLREELEGLGEVDEIEGRAEKGIECGSSGSRGGREEESERTRRGKKSEREKSAEVFPSLSRTHTQDGRKKGSQKKNVLSSPCVPPPHNSQQTPRPLLPPQTPHPSSSLHHSTSPFLPSPSDQTHPFSRSQTPLLLLQASATLHPHSRTNVQGSQTSRSCLSISLLLLLLRPVVR